MYIPGLVCNVYDAKTTHRIVDYDHGEKATSIEHSIDRVEATKALVASIPILDMFYQIELLALKFQDTVDSLYNIYQD